MSTKVPLLVVLLVGLAACEDERRAAEVLPPDWTAISAWPGVEVADASGAVAAVAATPDPEHVTTVVVLDDSGSMGRNMEGAKEAVARAVAALDPKGSVSVIALNRGELLPVTSVEEARTLIGSRLAGVYADGGTPLGRRMRDARRAIEADATARRGYGRYRIVVVTDGAASDEDALVREVREIVQRTPVQISTIGLGIGEGHILNQPGNVSYTSVDDVAALEKALTRAIAEEATFDPITSFDGSGS